jgi:maltose/moltooligosaccharide transporter
VHEEKSTGIWHDIVNMPQTMRQLGLVQFFSWFALFSMWVFTSDAVARHIFHLPAGDTTSAAYIQAGDLVGSSFGIYNIVSAFYALCLPFIASKIGRRNTHSVSLLAGGIGLLSIYFIQDPSMLKFSMIGVGMAWASILAMPYAMLAGGIPAAKMGIYMGIFNFFITMPQILNGLMGIDIPFLGMSLSKYFYGSNPIYAVMTGGVFMLLGAASCFLIKSSAEQGATELG